MNIEMNDELFLQLTEYCNRSDNLADNTRRARALGFTGEDVMVAPGRSFVWRTRQRSDATCFSDFIPTSTAT